VEQLEEGLALEEIDAHARQKWASPVRDAARLQPGVAHADRLQLVGRLRLLDKARDAPSIIGAQQAELRGLILAHRHDRERDLGLALAMRFQEVLEIHAIELIAR